MSDENNVSFVPIAPYLHETGSAEYVESSSIFNTMVRRRPAIVARPKTNNEIRDAIQHATSNGLSISIRNGGHSAYGFCVADGAMVVDTRLLNSIKYDSDADVLSVGAGVHSGELDTWSANYGIAIPLGDCPGVGVAGIALGGGNGLLSRRNGLTCDRLIGATLIDARGNTHEVDDGTHPDLMWALRGGGQCSFGVISQLRFRPCRVPERVVTGSIFAPLAKGPEMMPFVQELLDTHTHSLSLFIRINREWDDIPGIRIYGAFFGDHDTGTEIFKNIELAAQAMSSEIRIVTYREAQRINTSSVVGGMAFHWQNAIIRSQMNAELAVQLADAFLACPNDLGRINIDPLGGMVAERTVPSCFAYRDFRHILSIIGLWRDDSEMKKVRDWVMSTYAALTSHLPARPRYANYVHPDATAGDYFGPNLSRLQGLKMKYDPDDTFIGLLSKKLPWKGQQSVH